MKAFYSNGDGMVQSYPTVSTIPLNGTYNASIGFISDTEEFNFKGVFQIQIALIGTNDGGIVNVQQSGDGIFWDNFRTTNDYALASNSSVTFEDYFFSGRYFRILWSPNVGTTTGFIKAIVTKKNF
jgi:hypothetical protein